MNKKTILLLQVLLICSCLQAQNLKKPKKIKVKGDFEHKNSQTKFPVTFENTYERKNIFTFDKKKKNIGVTYKSIANPKTTFSIYVYPAEDGTEDRLRSEYLASISSVANLINNELGITQFPVKYIGDKYDCNGFKATFKTDKNENSFLTLYECGVWFLKLRITTEIKDSIEIANLEKKLLKKFNPSRLTDLKQLNPKADVYFAKAAFRDSILLGSVMGSAYKKIEWAMNNVSERERASGFPGQYLQIHVESLKEFTAFDKKYDYKKTEFTEKYLNELNSLIDSNFLDEFIMEQFNMILIVPEKHKFDFNKFEKWKEENELTINLNALFYVIAYGQE